MTDKELNKNAARRLAIIRHAEEVTVSFPRFSGHLVFGDTGRQGRSLDACTAPAGVPPPRC